MYALLKNKYENYVNDPKNPNIAKNIKANFSYKHKFKKVTNPIEAAEGDLRRSLEVKKIIQRTSTSLAGQKEYNPYDHVNNYVDFSRQKKRPPFEEVICKYELGYLHTKDVPFHQDPLNPKYQIPEQYNNRFDNQLERDHHLKKFKQTLNYKLNQKKDDGINF